MTRSVVECEHGPWPVRECNRHRPSRARRVLDVAVIVALVGLDAAALALTVALAVNLWRAAAAIMWGQP